MKEVLLALPTVINVNYSGWLTTTRMAGLPWKCPYLDQLPPMEVLLEPAG